MTTCARVVLTCALALILLPGAQAQTRKQFGPWAVVCSGGPTGYCSASNRIKSVSGPYRFQLNVSRERPGAQFELALLTGYQHPREGTAISVQVDAGKPLRLAAGAGYRRAGRSNTFIVASGETERLLQQMRKGKRVRFRFEDAKGASVDAPFSLAGLSGAIGLMDKLQPAPRVRASAAAVQPAAGPPALAEAKPTPAPASTPVVPAAQARASARTATPAPAETRAPAVPTTVPAPTEKQAPSAPTAAPAPTQKQAAAAPPATERQTPPASAAAPPASTAAPVLTERQASRAPATAATAAEKQTPPASTAAPVPTERQASRALTTGPTVAVKQAAPAATAAPASPATQATVAPAGRASAPATIETQSTPPATAAPAPVARETASAPTASTPAPARAAASAPAAPPAEPGRESTRAPAAAPAPITQTKPTPAPAAAAETAAASTQRPAAEPSRKPARAQQQAAVSTAPSASRKRGAKSIRQFSCVGAEPFWTLVIDGERARYVSLTDSGQRDTIELAGKLNVTGDGATPVVDWRGKSDWGGGFRAMVNEEGCHDNMSRSEGQTKFEYRVQVSLPGRKTVRGCCYAGLPPVEAAAPTDTTQYPVADLRSRPETDWSRYLFDLLPAIQACIDKTPEPEPYATKAWPMNRGMVGVRTRNGQGGWFECVAEASGKSIDRFVPLPSAAPLAPNEDRVVFSPPDHPPPADSCYKHERVMDGMGDFMGWLSTNGCS